MIYYFLIAIGGLVILKLLFLIIYCRFMKWFDARRKRHIKEANKNIRIDDGGNKNTGRKVPWMKRVILFFIDKFFYGYMRYSIITVGKIPSFFVRNILYRCVFATKITGKTVIYGGTEIRSPWNLKANNCVVANSCILDARNGIEIGENVVFGGGVHVWTEEHDVNDEFFSVSEKNRGAVIIDKHAWICSDSTILPGVHIGEGAVLASRACATKDLEPFGIYAGIPARKIGERNRNLSYELSGKPHYYFY